jgi:hypothetical protein
LSPRSKSKPDLKKSKDGGDSRIKRLRKESLVVQCKVLIQMSPGEAETHKDLDAYRQ